MRPSLEEATVRITGIEAAALRTDKEKAGDETPVCFTSIFRARKTMGSHTELIILDREIVFFFIVYKYRRPEVDDLHPHLEQVRHGMRSLADTF